MEPAIRSFSHGLSWLAGAFTLFRRQPFRLLLIALFMQLLLSLTRLPVIGLFLVLAVPGLTAGILEALHQSARGDAPSPGLLLRPLLTGNHSGRLLGLGALVFLVGVLFISLVLSGTASSLDPDLIQRIEQGDINAVAELEPGVLSRMVLSFAVGIAVSGTLSYFTIPLIWFGARPLGVALTEGLRALFRNWRPFVVLALALVVVLMPLSVLIGLLFTLAGAGGLMGVAGLFLIMILLLAFQMLLFGTQYCAYRDVFGIDAAAPAEPEDETQLLA
jgi:hypothetical protein